MLSTAGAQDGATADVQGVIGTMSGTDRAFVLLCACLIFLMQAGFCLLELGFVQAKNGINVVMKSLLDFSLASIVFIFGAVFMFGNSVSIWFGFGGWDHLLVSTC